MTMDRLLIGLAWLIALAIIFIGARFLLDPDTAAKGYGLPVIVEGDALGFLFAKGVRDIVPGLVVIVLLLADQKMAAGLFLLVAALIPIGDMAIVLHQGGPPAIAFGVHGATAVLLLVVGAGLVLRNRSPAHA